MMFTKDSMFRKTAVGLLAVTMLATACTVATTETTSPVAEAKAPQLMLADSSFDRSSQAQLSRQANARQAVGLAAQDDTPTDGEEPMEDEHFEEEFFEGVDWFAIVAEALNMDEDALWQAMEEGKTVAELAQAANVDVQTIVDALKTAETDFINQLVTDGVITQAEADEWLAELDAEIQSFVEESFADMFIGADLFTVAAEALGMDDKALWEAMESGKTVADIAAENGVEVQTIIDALIAAETESINQAVADGKLTQEEADEWLSFLPEEVRAFVEDGFEECEGEFHEEEFFGVDWFDETAKLLNMDEDAMWEALDSGQTIAELATAAGIDPQTIVDALIAADTEAINKAVADGELTQAEADEWLPFLAEDANSFVNESLSSDIFEDDFFEDFEDDFDGEPDAAPETGNA